jgi:hypothetical protein
MVSIRREIITKYPRCIFVYMDDILITTPDDEELHAAIVNEVLDMLAVEDFFLKLSKCSFHLLGSSWPSARLVRFASLF